MLDWEEEARILFAVLSGKNSAEIIRQYDNYLHESVQARKGLNFNA
jgi:hypothetical protein